jgi:glutamine cyclotransferase
MEIVTGEVIYKLDLVKAMFNCERLLASSLLTICLTACDGNAPANRGDSNQSHVSTLQTTQQNTARPNATNAAAENYPIYGYEVVHAWPHDRGAFTQGLVFHDGELLESTGLYGQSSLRRVDLDTGKILQQVAVSPQFFAEGLALVNGKLFQLTWQNQKGFVYDSDGFRQIQEFSYQGEGWGLTTDGQSLIMSDGSDQIRFLDPVTFEEKRRFAVLAHGRPVIRLNELEYIKGEIFANIWGTDHVARIDAATGKVVGAIDFTGLLAVEDRDANTDVLNGIAYDATGDRLFVTGKRWPKLFQVRLKLKN